MTLMKQAARSVPDIIKRAAKIEGIDAKKLARSVAAGRSIVPHNPKHRSRPCGIGEGLRVKVNANIGTSPDHCSLKEELVKAKVAVELGADAIMDLSIGGNIDAIRKAIIKKVDVAIGTVPIYQAANEAGHILDMNEDIMFKTIEKHARDGVDFMTVHCGVTKASVESLRKAKRICDIVSRGGSFLAVWILKNKQENPLYKHFDYLLELAKEHEFVLSLGDGLRPGSILDATDKAQIHELRILGELVKRSRKAGVQVMVEGPGHVPLNQIEQNVRLEKTICKGAPFYVLGPLVTDIAPGYDHIFGAIGGALAAYYGADFLCYVTPAEHLGLPDLQDVKDGVIASKIAAHAADLTRNIDWEKDRAMSKARKALDWDGMFKHALDPVKARKKRDQRPAKLRDKACSMCGKFCAMTTMNELL
jgi:phosphomethylpyrimidine synthase